MTATSEARTTKSFELQAVSFVVFSLLSVSVLSCHLGVHTFTPTTPPKGSLSALQAHQTPDTSLFVDLSARPTPTNTPTNLHQLQLHNMDTTTDNTKKHTKKNTKNNTKKDAKKKDAKKKNGATREGPLSRKRKLFQTISEMDAFDRALCMIPKGSVFARVEDCLKRGKALSLVKYVKYLRTKLRRAERELAQVQKDDRAPIKRVKITKPTTKQTKTRSTTASLTKNDRRAYLALCDKHGLTRGTWDIPRELRIDPVVNGIAEKLEAVRRASKVANPQQRTQALSAPSASSSSALSNSSPPEGSPPDGITKAP